MSKLEMIPEFTEGGETSEEVVKEEEELEAEPLEEEETESEPTEDKKPAQEESKEITSNDKTTDAEKLLALEALRKQEEALDKDTSELDLEIKARKERIVEKRRERREKRELVGKIDEIEPTAEDKLEDIDPTTLQILERYTKAKGLVPRSEIEKTTYESQHKTAEDVFYKDHKEYLPENDKDDVLYKALKNELSLFARPSNPSLISKLFEKAHNEVKKQHPQFFKESSLTEKINANQRINSASMGGGKTGGTSQRTSKAEGGRLSDKDVQTLLRGGWSEKEIAELNKK